MANEPLTNADLNHAALLFSRDLTDNIPLTWEDLETGFDSSGAACGEVIIWLYNNRYALIAAARDGLALRTLIAQIDSAELIGPDERSIGLEWVSDRIDDLIAAMGRDATAPGDAGEGEDG